MHLPRAARPVVTVIRPAGRPSYPDLGELWAHRDVLRMLIWREIALRYKQTVVGVAWAVLQPATTALVAGLFLGVLAGLPSDGLPYPLFAAAGLVPWTYLSHALTKASLSIVDQHAVITKVYFPRLLIPLAAVVAALIDLGLAGLALVAVMLAHGIVPGPGLLLLPAVLLLLVVTAFGAGLWLAALHVEYRDFGNALPFLLQLLLFLTPVFYPGRLVPEEWAALYWLNPVAGAVEGFRWALLGGESPAPLAALATSAGAALVLLLGGLRFFRGREGRFADVV
jgi:lipopolysaccharide transport system permease protein